MDNDFVIHTESRPHRVGYASISGSLHGNNAEQLMQRCQALRSRGCQTLLLNLSQVSFIASSGVGTLLALAEEMKDSGRELHLIDPSETVLSVLQLLKLARYLSIASSEADALGTTQA